jgi:hypothetical protein
VRKALDSRDGFIGEKRAAKYVMFSELAGHPDMKSVLMMRPHRNGDAFIGPFVEVATLEAVISEMGHLAIEFGKKLDFFFPDGWDVSVFSRLAFAQCKQLWLATFYPPASATSVDAAS